MAAILEQSQEGRLGRRRAGGASLARVARRGRARAGPWLLLVPLAFFAFAVLRLTGVGEDAGESAGPPPAGTAPDERVRVWRGAFEHEGEVLQVWLAPLHGERDWQAHDASALARALGTPHRGDAGRDSAGDLGEPFRLTLQGTCPDGFAASALAVRDEGDALLVGPLGDATAVAEPGPVRHPLRTLFTLGATDGATTSSWILWGTVGDGARPVLEWGRDESSVVVPLAEEQVVCGSFPRHVARVERAVASDGGAR